MKSFSTLIQEYWRNYASKRGCSVVSALASRATGTGTISGFGKGIFGVRTRFPSCICRHEMKTARRPSDRHVNWRPPVQAKSRHVQVKEHYGIQNG